MKIIHLPDETHINDLCEMANLTPKRTGLNVQIWADHSGFKRNKKDKYPRVKLGKDNVSISISISEHPVVLVKSGKIKKSDENDFLEGEKYIAKNSDIFLKHYFDEDDSFDDDDLKQELKLRGYYKF